MQNDKLRDALIEQLWRMNKMDIISHLLEFIEGELATLWFLKMNAGQTVIPSMISDSLRISRARTAIILRTLREKGYVFMEISEEDRRKMTVVMTEDGERYLSEKYKFLLDYFDKFIEVLGAEKIRELTALLQLTADKEAELSSWIRDENQTKEEKKDDR